MIIKEYYAEPTGILYHQSPANVRYLEGPVGSGKSTASVEELLALAMEQQPDEQGVRLSRMGIIRATNPQLRSTTIKTFEMWVPPEIAPVVYTAPITARLQQELSDGTRIDCEFVFLALDVPEDVKKLTSLELTAAYINEAREIEHTHFETLQGRIGRYPQIRRDENKKVVYGPTRACIIMDSNAPKTTHWLYETFHTGSLPDGYAIFIQPPAVIWSDVDEKWEINPDAENLLHLLDGYYQKQLAGASDEYIRVMLAGEPGMSVAGKPVFPSYSERRHVASQVLVPIRGIPLIIGIDFGLMPAAVFGQLTNRGLRIYDELPASDESLEDFAQDYIKPLLAKKYAGFQVVGAGDPAGRGRSGLDKRTPFSVLNEAGIRAFPASTNNFITRKETVEWFMRRDEGFLISPNCVTLREGFAGGYVYKEMRNNSGRYSERPDKNMYSHPMDATQYLALWAKYGYVATKKDTDKDRKPFLFA